MDLAVNMTLEFEESIFELEVYFNHYQSVMRAFEQSSYLKNDNGTLGISDVNGNEFAFLVDDLKRVWYNRLTKDKTITHSDEVIEWGNSYKKASNTWYWQ